MNIQREEVVFNSDGQWSHSAIQGLGEEFDEVPFKDIHHFTDFDMLPILIHDQDKIDLLCGTYPNEGPADFRKWQPDPPKSAEWFPFEFADGEDGPYVLYVREKLHPQRVENKL